MKRILSIILFFFSLFIQGQTVKVLFIGNSYTNDNDLPQTIANIASSMGDNLQYGKNIPNGYSWRDHSTNSTTLNLIRQGGWNFVVLQEFSQYPSEPIDWVVNNVFNYAQFFDSEINTYNPNAETMFYMTWGRKDGDASRCSRLPEVCTYTGMDDLTRERYMIMAEDNRAVVSPVGAVWRYIRDNYSDLELYDYDGSHPSYAGTYAAACCFYTAIFRKDPTLITYNAGQSSSNAEKIKLAVKNVVYNNLLTWHIGEYDQDTQPPSIPTGLAATDISETSFTLSWNPSTDNVGVTGYEVYQNGVMVKTVTGTSTHITGLNPSTTYTMTVKAKDAVGNTSEASSSLYVTTSTAEAEAPSVPTGLTASNITDTSFTLSWNASTDNVGVTGYDVYQNSLYLRTVAGTSTNITGLSASKTYAMTIRAKDDAGNTSGASSVLNITTPDTTAPSVPTGLAANNITETSFILTWTGSSDNIGVTNYEIFIDGTFFSSFTATSAVLTGLKVFTEYAITVKAKDAANNASPPSAKLIVTTADLHPPTAPTGLNAFYITDSGFTLSWTASSDNVAVAGYDIYKDDILIDTSIETTIRLLGLSPSTQYAIKVVAKDAAGNLSFASDPIDIITDISKSLENNGSVLIYPNPVNGSKFFVRLHREGITKITLEIINLSGDVLFKDTIRGADRILIIPNVVKSSGIYLIRINDGKSITNRKVLFNSD